MASFTSGGFSALQPAAASPRAGASTRAISSSAFSVRPISAVSCARRARMAPRSVPVREGAELLVEVVERGSEACGRLAVELVDAGLRALADGRRAAELRQEDGERVLAGDRRLRRAARTTRGSAAPRGRRRRAPAPPPRGSPGPRSPVRRGSGAGPGGGSGRGQPVQQPALRVDLGHPALDSLERRRAARPPRSASRARSRSSSARSAATALARRFDGRIAAGSTRWSGPPATRGCALPVRRRRVDAAYAVHNPVRRSGFFRKERTFRRFRPTPAGPYPAPRGSP